MAKFVVLLVFVCFQFSRQEKLADTENISSELIKSEIQPPAEDISNSEILDGADENQWYKGGDDKHDGTEEDEKWLQEIQSILEGSNEDYDDDSSEIENMMDEIEAWIKKTHPGKSNYKWLIQIKNWFDEIYDDYWDLDISQYPDILSKEESIKVDKNNDFALFYSWLYRMKLRNFNNEKVQSVKRFSSV